MSKKKKENNITVSFVDSNSAKDVTGSSILVKTPNHNILIECGLTQTNDKYEDFLVNNRKTKEYKAKDISLVFVCHNHGDHSLLVPKLFRDGCEAGVIIPERNKSVYEKMLVDSAHIAERDIEIINDEHGKKYKPLYDLGNVNKTIEHTKEFPVNQKIQIDDEISFKFIPSGHLLGACQLILYITINGITKVLGYTSDIGSNKVHNHFVGNFEPITEYCNAIIGESTYGNRPDVKVGKKERKNDLEKLKSIIDTQIRDMHGRCIIPSFAQSRCQQLALLIYQMYKDNEEFQPKVYIDSPLAIQIFKEYQGLLDGEEKELYDEMMNWDKLKFIKESMDSKALVESDEPCVILTTNGMATVGRVLNHLRKCVPNPNATVLFAGYSSDNSLATSLKNKDVKKVMINGIECTCRCSIYSMKSFSGHAMFNQLLNYYSDLHTDKIVLHHGQEEAKLYLKGALEKELEKKCKSTRVVVANSSLKFSL